MDQTQPAIVQRRLDQEQLDARIVLDVLVQTLVGRHVDCQLEKIPGRLPTRGGQWRSNALVAAMDALHEGRYRRAKDDPAMARVQELLFNLLGECQLAAEKTAGLDDNNPGGRMRIVKD